MAIARELVGQTPVGEAERWVRQAARETNWPRKLAWILAGVAVGAAALLLALAIARNDPTLRKLAAAPEDDEPMSAEERAEVDRARGDIQAGRGVPLDEYLSRHKDA